MPRPKFSLKTMLWLMVVVAAFVAGAAGGNRRATEVIMWERKLFRQRIRKDRTELQAKEQEIKELKEHVHALEHQQP